MLPSNESGGDWTLYSYLQIAGVCGEDNKAALTYWWETYSAHQKVKSSYKANHVVERSKMDNKDKVVYNGGRGNRNKIRIPKKNRKGAWKKFYKLFPHLKPKDKDEE